MPLNTPSYDPLQLAETYGIQTHSTRYPLAGVRYIIMCEFSKTKEKLIGAAIA